MKITVPPPDFLSDVRVVGGHISDPKLSRLTNLHWSVHQAPPGDWVEFGVKRGKSARYLHGQLPRDTKLLLLDSFEGLPEDFVVEHLPDGRTKAKAKGAFACDPPHFVDPAVTIIKGWFEDTVGQISYLTASIGFVHIDCDLYSSTLCALKGIEDLLLPGAVIQFDELWGFPNWRECEYRALQESGLRYEWIARNHNDAQATLRLLT